MKKIKEYWYYYKAWVITGVLALGLVIYCLANAGGEEKFDRYAAVISSEAYTEEAVEALKQALNREYGSFGVRVYRITLGALNQDDAALAKLGLDLGKGLSDTLLIEDPEAFYTATDGLETSEPVRVSEVPFLAGIGFDELWLVTR